MVLAIILWSGCCLLFISSRVVAPKSSLFPEIDFGSKCVPLGAVHTNGRYNGVSSVGQLLYSLSNANSKDVSKKLTGVTVYVGSSAVGSNPPHVILATEKGQLHDLVKGVNYC
jgi:hypothetical protein